MAQLVAIPGDKDAKQKLTNKTNAEAAALQRGDKRETGRYKYQILKDHLYLPQTSDPENF